MPFAKVNLSAFILFGAAGYLLSGPILGVCLGTLACALVLAWHMISTQMVLSALKAQRMTDAFATSNVIYRLFLGDAQALRDAAGVRGTQFFLIETHVPLAFSMGGIRGANYIVVTTGLFKTLTRLEISAVIGHEFGHIKVGDSALNAMRLSLSLLVSKLRIRPALNLFRKCLPQTSLLADVLMKPECRADAFSAQLCQDAKVLASALKKLERGARAVQWSALDTLPFLAHVTVIDPFAAQKSYDRPENSRTAYRVAELYRLEPVKAA